jgi:hypothetical protein
MPRVNKWVVIASALAIVLAAAGGLSWHIYRLTHFSFEGRLDSSRPADQLILLAVKDWRQIPPPERREDVFNSRADAASDIAIALNEMDDSGAALEMARAADGGDLYAAYSEIAARLAQEGRDDEADAVAMLTAHDHQPSIWVWSSILDAQARRGDLAGVKASIGKFARNGNTDTVWLIAARGACAGKYFDSAQEAIAAIHKPLVRVNAMGSLARAQAQANDRDGANRTIALALAECRNIPQSDRESQAAGDLVEALAYLGRIDEARQVITTYSTKVGQDEIVRGLADAGNFAAAMKVADEKHLDASYQAIASAQIKRGDFKSARATAGKIDPTNFYGTDTANKRARILAEIAHAELAAGDAASALKDVADARQLLLAEPKTALDKRLYRLDPRTFGTLAGIEIRAGVVDEAIARIKDAPTATPEFRSEAYAAAAKEVARKYAGISIIGRCTGSSGNLGAAKGRRRQIMEWDGDADLLSRLPLNQQELLGRARGRVLLDVARLFYLSFPRFLESDLGAETDYFALNSGPTSFIFKGGVTHTFGVWGEALSLVARPGQIEPQADADLAFLSSSTGVYPEMKALIGQSCEDVRVWKFEDHVDDREPKQAGVSYVFSGGRELLYCIYIQKEGSSSDELMLVPLRLNEVGSCYSIGENRDIFGSHRYERERGMKAGGEE